MDKIDELINDFDRKTAYTMLFDATEDDNKSKTDARAALRAEFERLQQELAALRERTRWIPVGERLPENNEEVLTVYGGIMNIQCYIPQYNVWQEITDDMWVEFTRVTHWMPLPEPPAEEQ